jgi:hypothetical protein
MKCRELAFIYGLYDPDDPYAIRYVGRTQQLLSDRLNAHRSNWRLKNTPVSRWIASLREEGRKPDIVLLEAVPVERAVEAEDYWIEGSFQWLDSEILNRYTSKGKIPLSQVVT